MSFQAYLDNIRSKTGKTPEDFRAVAAEAGLLDGEVTATQIVAWLAKDYGLGRGHAMAIYEVFKRNSWITPVRKSRPKRPTTGDRHGN